MARPVLIYDADCGFCTTSARWIAARWHEPAEAVPAQHLGADGLARVGLTVADAQRAAWWVDQDGRRFGGHAAVAHALMAAGRWQGAAGHVLVVPPVSWLAAVGYRLVARYRHRLPGATPACRL